MGNHKICKIILIGLGLLCLNLLAHGEETCSWKADGSKVCEDDESEPHNVWTELDEAEVEDGIVMDNEVEEDDEGVDVTERTSGKSESPLLSEKINELELEVFVQFFSLLKDWSPTSESLEKYNPETIVAGIVDSFNKFDTNDDAILTYDEFESVLAVRDTHEDLTKIEEAFGTFEQNQITILQFIELFGKLGDGTEITSIIAPFEKLDYMPPAAAKKIIQGSLQMFFDSDQDFNGELDKDEFTFGMKKSQEKRKVDVPIEEEHVNALFDMIDKDKDLSLTYTEFQETIPKKPKSMDETLDDIFNETDLDSDGVLSKEEFEAHMKSKAASMKMEPLSDEQLLEGFTKLDTNDDGVLSQQEVKLMFAEMKNVKENQMKEAFSSFDADLDGELSMEELEKIVKGIQETTGQAVDIKIFMDLLDQNKDGKVSLEEMQFALQKMGAVPPMMNQAKVS